jgi:hypothetical protein
MMQWAVATDASTSFRIEFIAKEKQTRAELHERSEQKGDEHALVQKDTRINMSIMQAMMIANETSTHDMSDRIDLVKCSFTTYN